jgi:N-acetylmuramoyl-L-alanine amidase
MSNCYLRDWSPLIRAAVCTGLVTLLPVLPTAARSRTSHAPAQINAVQVEGRGKNATVRVGVTRPCRVVRTRLRRPERLVLDFTPARWKGDHPVKGKGTPVRSVRIAQHPGRRVRLVVDTGARPARWSGRFQGEQWVARGRLQPPGRGDEGESVLDARALRRSLRGMVIGIDAGHGGSDPGAIAKSGLEEKKVTLKIAKQLRRMLIRQGARVRMTRVDDRRLREESRIAFVSGGGLDLIVSIHCDAFDGSPHCTGITTYYHDGSRRGAALAEALQRRLPGATGLPNRGARADTSLYESGLYVLRNAACPAVLVETGYLSCAPTAARLRDPGFRTQVARGIVQGLQHYIVTRPVRTARR